MISSVLQFVLSSFTQVSTLDIKVNLQLKHLLFSLEHHADLPYLAGSVRGGVSFSEGVPDLHSNL